ncbi:hypothetical protein Tco_0765263 [Tanacetum coccineum]
MELILIKIVIFGFLVIHHNYRISYDDITSDLYWDDNYNTKSVSQEVMPITEDANAAVNSSFLLDDNSSRVCGNSHGLIRKYRLAKEIGFIKVDRSPSPVAGEFSSLNTYNN